MPFGRALGVPALLLAFLATVAADTPSGDPQRALGTIKATDSETVVDIPDAVLRKAVEGALEKDPNQLITRGEMESLEELSAVGVHRLHGIEYAVNLHVLSVRNGEISNLAPLAGLALLNRLDLHGNEIFDLTPLAGLASLQHLDLGWQGWREEGLPRLSDSSALAGLQSLRHLDLGGNEIFDLAPLAGLASLRILDLSSQFNGVTWARLSDSDLAPLAGLASLERLILRQNGISDVRPLSGLVSLRHLNLSNNEISDVRPLSGLVSLEWLILNSNGISDVRPLSGLASLVGLDLSVNSISDVRLSGLPSLVTLELDLNKISDMELPTSLTYLSLNRNEISDLAPISGLASLQYLNIAFNNVWDVGPLSDLASLKHVQLYRNHIADAAPLVENIGFGGGDHIDLRSNPLNAKSIETDVPTLLKRGVEVLVDDAVLAGVELAEIEDPRLRVAFVTAVMKWRSQLGHHWASVTLDDFAGIRYLDASSRGIEGLGGLELANSLEILDLSGNSVTDIASVAGLTSLRHLYLNRNDISDIGPLAGLDLAVLSLDENAIEDFAGAVGWVEGLVRLVSQQQSSQRPHPPDEPRFPRGTPHPKQRCGGSLAVAG